MFLLIVYILFFIFLTSVSVTLLGDRTLLSQNLFSFKGVIFLLVNWKFYSAVFCALLARISFTLMNIQLYKMPLISKNSTNITSIIGNSAIIGVLLTNYFFLDEILTIKQFIGMLIVFIGLYLILN